MRYQIINDRKRALNLTNAQLAEKANITLSTLDKITSGANDNPKLSTLQAIARVIGCTLDDFDDQHDVVNSLSEDALAVARAYDKLDEHGRRVVSAVLELEVDRCSYPIPEERLHGMLNSQQEIIDKWFEDVDITDAHEA